MPDDREKFRHLLLDGFTETAAYRSPNAGGRPPSIPDRDRRSHGSSLMTQVNGLRSELERVRREYQQANQEEGIRLQVEFQSFPDVKLLFEKLAREKQGIELLNVRRDDEAKTTLATVSVPDGKLSHFEKLIQDYLEEKTDRVGRARDNKRLLNAIESIRAASLQSLWTDSHDVFPGESEEIWWEVWLPIRGDRQGTTAYFVDTAQAMNLQLASGQLEFPERTVLMVRASPAQLKRSGMLLNTIAELRRAKETADFFDSLHPQEQAEWVNELLGRTSYAPEEADAPYVCLLDTGVNRGHPLIAHALATADLHTVEPSWGVEDSEGHGTNMAGLTLFGDLTGALTSSGSIRLPHRLESVKLLPHDGGNGRDPQHHGFLTKEAVSRPEVTGATRLRAFCMPVTARDNRDRGRPSAWSAALDSLAADSDGDGTTRRLLVVSAGNIDDLNAWGQYPNSNSTDGIHDPGQAWNALTVGACTHLTRVAEQDAQGYQPIAPAGGLSPFSTTSLTWPDTWPFKPDVVFEGGNAARDSLSPASLPSLRLLTTHHKTAERLFTTSNATSSAAALAARMAATLWSVYPNLWPETVRGLIVHSAEWTDAMRQMFLPRDRQPTKADYLHLIRHCGFGLPSLDMALWSISNSLTLIVENQFRPFAREGSNDPTFREMNLHPLPWPLRELEALGETPVEMRVTLSYFVEPNPSARGVSSRYRYQSHGLRFDVKRPAETEESFRSRINLAARAEEEGTTTGSNDPDWDIGIQNRHKGSLHSDIWRGTAADLASRGVLAVYPALGWWKTRPKLECYNKSARYSLIISIRAPEVETDLYTPIANQIGIPVSVET